MSKRSTLSAIFGRIGSAMRAANAVEARRAPRSSDLTALGIDPVQFSKIGQ